MNMPKLKCRFVESMNTSYMEWTATDDYSLSIFQLVPCSDLIDSCDQHCARPTNDISMKFEIQRKFVMLLFIAYLTDHNEIWYTSRQ